MPTNFLKNSRLSSFSNRDLLNRDLRRHQSNSSDNPQGYVHPYIDNLLNAIQQGILTPSTKQRMEELEQQKSELSVQIMKEEMTKPSLTKDQIVFWLYRFRKLNTDKLEHRRRLIDSFVNAIFLYDDRITFTFNYKDGSKTITFTELEKSSLGSDINALAAPYRVFLTNLRVG